MHKHQLCFGTTHTAWLLLSWQDCDLKYRRQNSSISSISVSSLPCPKDYWPRGMKSCIHFSQMSCICELSSFINSSLSLNQSKFTSYTHLGSSTALLQLCKSRQTSSDRCSVSRESLKWDYLLQGIWHHWEGEAKVQKSRIKLVNKGRVQKKEIILLKN